VLQRASEMLLANAVLARDCAAVGDGMAAAAFAAEVERLAGAGAAVWTRDVAARLARHLRGPLLTESA